MSSQRPPSSSSFQAHPSLPQKPPASSNGSSRAPAFKPRNIGPSPGYSSSYASPASYPQLAPACQQLPPSYPQPQANPYDYSHATPPQIANPFAAPGSIPAAVNGSTPAGYDPDEAQAIANWQSAYSGTGDQAAAKSSAGNTGTAVAAQVNTEQSQTPADKQKTVIRSGGGESWQDPTLLEWDPTHPRFFVGNLAGEVSDDSLMKAFAKYPSVVRARVVRDKRTTKSKGFGFISFSNAEEFQRAGKEMQGKYIGSHPIILRRAKTDVKAVAVPEKHKKRGRGGGGGQNGTGAGVQKHQKKNKGGMDVIG